MVSANFLPMRHDDISRWRRLMVRTQSALKMGPDHGHDGLGVAAERAYRACLPFPPYSRENPFERLIDAARSYAAETDHLGRTVKHRMLKTAFDRCFAAWPTVFDAVAPPSPKRSQRPSDAWKNRKDIGDAE